MGEVLVPVKAAAAAFAAEVLGVPPNKLPLGAELAEEAAAASSSFLFFDSYRIMPNITEPMIARPIKNIQPKLDFFG